MLNLFKRKKRADNPNDTESADAQAPAEQSPKDTGSQPETETENASAPAGAETAAQAEQASTPEADSDTDAQPTKSSKGLFARLKAGLAKTRKGFSDSLASLILGRKEIDDDLLDELEMILLSADIGIEATDEIIENLTDQVSRKTLKDPQALIDSLKAQLTEMLAPVSKPLAIPDSDKPYVILMVGVNGVGKTTTIGKLAKKFQDDGRSVMLAAGDTFRAAAVEQLQTWGERNRVPVMAQKTGADSAAVIFDAIQSATAKNMDILIADTAGRLHTQSNLMEELKKVKRVMQKVDATAPHEVMLVLDAGNGQNALSQARQFHQAVDVTGLTLTKLDGTAKGGIIVALSKQLGLPVRFIGVGESMDDLRPFDAESFVDALFARDDG
ncbi:MAG: signal recognition particle-docking protein FtsY [Hydrogenovibrio sp.]|uniref:signal recognition particle-docking protein FtsY n=1 Tax=Hydrogenovibrio sp. TaxID=2065821 RepID=UPI00286FD702|nr:signal recognition particle-docking protein FtsY [Hydrogenovibrio sp.]MDR9499411.1 signal recognition particle-docking protein FtsY [Hydrogenovibrio sp.]